MPRPKKRGKGRNKEHLRDPFFWHAMLTGHFYFGRDPTMEERKLAWEEMREELLKHHRNEKGLFTRPAAWWWFEAPELRMWIAEHPMPPVCYEKEPWLGRSYTKEQGIAAECYPENYETERDYLLRHPGLLSKKEKKELSQ